MKGCWKQFLMRELWKCLPLRGVHYFQFTLEDDDFEDSRMETADSEITLIVVHPQIHCISQVRLVTSAHNNGICKYSAFHLFLVNKWPVWTLQSWLWLRSIIVLMWCTSKKETVLFFSQINIFSIGPIINPKSWISRPLLSVLDCVSCSLCKDESYIMNPYFFRRKCLQLNYCHSWRLRKATTEQVGNKKPRCMVSTGWLALQPIQFGYVLKY